MIIVSNTSPISNLIIIGEIALLQQIYPKVLIPPAVHSELTRLPILQPTMLSLLGAGWLKIETPTNLQLYRHSTRRLIQVKPKRSRWQSNSVLIGYSLMNVSVEMWRRTMDSNSEASWEFSFIVNSRG